MLNNYNFALFSSYFCAAVMLLIFFLSGIIQISGNKLKASKFKSCISKSIFLTCTLFPYKNQWNKWMAEESQKAFILSCLKIHLVILICRCSMDLHLTDLTVLVRTSPAENKIIYSRDKKTCSAELRWGWKNIPQLSQETCTIRLPAAESLMLEGTSLGHLVHGPCSSKVSWSRLPRTVSVWVWISPWMETAQPL